MSRCEASVCCIELLVYSWVILIEVVAVLKSVFHTGENWRLQC